MTFLDWLLPLSNRRFSFLHVFSYLDKPPFITLTVHYLRVSQFESLVEGTRSCLSFGCCQSRREHPCTGVSVIECFHRLWINTKECES